MKHIAKEKENEHEDRECGIMGTPYLNRDESIILTTHNVDFNSLIAELILTDQRLIIFDTGHAQFRYQTIPLATIGTVIAREDEHSNPVMYISLTPLSQDSAPQTKEFTFLRQGGGERKKECEVWITHLKELMYSIRQQKFLATQLPSPKDNEIQFDDADIPLPEPVRDDTTRSETAPHTSESFLVPVSSITASELPGDAGIQDSPPDTGESIEQTAQAVAEEVHEEPVSSVISPPPVESARPMLIAIAAIIVVVLAIAVGLFVYSAMPGAPAEPAAPVITPALTTAATTLPTTAVQQTPIPQITSRPTPWPIALIPEKGVWVKVNYDGNYIGRVGTAGDMRQVNASGEQFYQLAITEGTVEASIQKQDGSGKVLTIEVYQNGIMMGRSTKASPGALIDLRVELKNA